MLSILSAWPVSAIVPAMPRPIGNLTVAIVSALSPDGRRPFWASSASTSSSYGEQARRTSGSKLSISSSRGARGKTRLGHGLERGAGARWRAVQLPERSVRRRRGAPARWLPPHLLPERLGATPARPREPVAALELDAERADRPPSRGTRGTPTAGAGPSPTTIAPTMTASSPPNSRWSSCPCSLGPRRVAGCERQERPAGIGSADDSGGAPERWRAAPSRGLPSRARRRRLEEPALELAVRRARVSEPRTLDRLHCWRPIVASSARSSRAVGPPLANRSVSSPAVPRGQRSRPVASHGVARPCRGNRRSTCLGCEPEDLPVIIVAASGPPSTAGPARVEPSSG